MDDQLQLTDLIPRRIASVMGLFLVGAGCIVAVALAHAWLPVLCRYSARGKLPALDLAGDQSIAVWLTSIWLALAGLVSLLVYTVRQHRCDDYAGHYRIWLWGTACWFLLSLDRTPTLHERFRYVMVELTGTRLYGDGAAWWAIPYVFFVGAIGLRLLLDMRESWSASLSLAASAVCYAVAVAVQFGWLDRLPSRWAALASGDVGPVLLEQGAKLAATLLLLVSLVLQARFVILDAEGRIPHRRVRVRNLSLARRSVTRASDLSPTMVAIDDSTQTPVFVETAIDSAHGIGTPVMTTAGPAFVTTPVTMSDGSGARRLTKAEKKALRKRLGQMRSQRERGW